MGIVKKLVYSNKEDIQDLDSSDISQDGIS